MFEVLATWNSLSISFPNTGGIAVSSYALVANFRIPLLPPSPLRGREAGCGARFRKKARRLNLIYF